jgi:hypothetical protein
MNAQDTQLKRMREKMDTGNMLRDFAAYEHELALRQSWEKSVQELFNDHPDISEFTWKQYSQRSGGFYCGSQEVVIDGIEFHNIEGGYAEDHVLHSTWMAWKDVVELLGFYTGSELRMLFGNFVEITVRRDDLVQFRICEG